MGNIKGYKLFDSTVYKSGSKLEDYNIILDIQDILLELEDANISCRIWINDYRGYPVSNKPRVPKIDKINKIEIEISYDD